MTKSELVDRLCQAGGISLARSEAIVDAIFDSIERALKNGERTEIRGFGSFELRSYGEYTGRNPRSGSTVLVKAKRLPFFKAGKELKDRINEAAQLKFARRRGPLSATVPATASSPTAAAAELPNERASKPGGGGAAPGATAAASSTGGKAPTTRTDSSSAAAEFTRLAALGR